jgi:hypothetical protein
VREVFKMRVSPEGAHKFISLYILLLYYAGQERRLLPRGMTLDDFKESGLDLKIACRDAIYEPRHLIMRFHDANRDLLTTEAQKTLESWANGYVKGRFYVLRHLKQNSIFMLPGSKPRAYGVLGLTDELDKVIPKAALPAYVETVLLPYEGVVVCDGLVLADTSKVGPPVRHEMSDLYKEIKQSGDLITSLD